MRVQYKLTLTESEGLESIYGIRQMTVLGCCNHHYDTSDSINGREFFYQLSGYHFLKELCYTYCPLLKRMQLICTV